MNIEKELFLAGFTPPEYWVGRTTCPECSHTRSKPDEKCVSVYLFQNRAHCHHCAKTWEFAA